MGEKERERVTSRDSRERHCERPRLENKKRRTTPTKRCQSREAIPSIESFASDNPVDSIEGHIPLQETQTSGSFPPFPWQSHSITREANRYNPYNDEQKQL